MHDLALFGFGVVIPSEIIDQKGIDLEEVAERYGLYVDWIESAVDDQIRPIEEITYTNVYVITYKDTRKEIYDCNYGIHTWFQNRLCWENLGMAKVYFRQLADKLDMVLDPQWILAVYRM